MEVDIEDENYIYTPTSYAKDRAIGLLKKIGANLPKGHVSLENRGGIDIEWENNLGYRFIVVRVRANEDLEDSVFYCDDELDTDYLIKNPSIDKIIELLQWLGGK